MNFIATNKTFMECQILICVLNALRKACAVKIPNPDGTYTVTAGTMYAFADRETLKEWAATGKGSDYETRAKFVLKELERDGVIGKGSEGYVVDLAKLEELENEALRELLTNYLSVEEGLADNGLLDRDTFEAFYENGGTPFFLSLDDLEEACELYARYDDLTALI